MPIAKNHATRDSLSRRFGLQEFPAHTDCAYLRKPPRFILLRYVGEGEKVAPTIILSLNLGSLDQKELDFLQRSIWIVRGAKGKFYSKILDRGMLRYDSEVMSLVSDRENLMKQILAKANRQKIHWEKNKVAIINNWTCLHFRPRISTFEKEIRILQRLNVI